LDSGREFMRHAIRVFYLGNNYHGFQLQNDLDTIEKRIRDALHAAGYLEKDEPFLYASRTDKGVDALQQVIAFDTEERLILPKINMKLPDDIIMWASTPVATDFSPRFHAMSRSYEYICRHDGEDVDDMKAASRLFVGTHDFRNFCKYVEGTMTNRTITYINVELKDDFLTFRLKAPSFLYQMVRRIVNCLLLVGKEQLHFEDILSLLTGELVKEKRIGPAPLKDRGTLILSEIEYPFKFVVDSYCLEKLSRFLNKQFNFHFFNQKKFSEYHYRSRSFSS